MKRFLFNLIWYLAVVIIADLLPLGIFFRLHMIGSLGNIAPTVIASALFFILIAIQAMAHLYQLNKRYPERESRNVWVTLTVTGLAVLTFWAIVISLIVWASSQA